MIQSFEPKDLPVAKVHEILLGTVAPRPIAWASTIDNEGNVNLAPFSFFNVFGSNPPIMVFSPNRRVRDNTSKHTLENIVQTRECVINIVNYELSGQMALTSTEYTEDVNEFEKAGLSMEPSLKVKPPRVKEAIAQYECIVRDIIHTGDGGGAANLIICEVVHIHVYNSIFNEENKVDPYKVDNIGRLSGIWYTRAKEGLFQMSNPAGHNNIGFDGLPKHAVNSTILTGSELSLLARSEKAPNEEELSDFRDTLPVKMLIEPQEKFILFLHQLTKDLLAEGKTNEALKAIFCI